jgi:hypothetical protein
MQLTRPFVAVRKSWCEPSTYGELKEDVDLLQKKPSRLREHVPSLRLPWEGNNNPVMYMCLIVPLKIENLSGMP